MDQHSPKPREILDSSYGLRSLMTQVDGAGGVGLVHDSGHNGDCVPAYFTFSPAHPSARSVRQHSRLHLGLHAHAVFATATAEDTTPAFLIDPQSLHDNTEANLPPASEGTETTLHVDQDDIILIVPGRGGHKCNTV